MRVLHATLIDPGRYLVETNVTRNGWAKRPEITADGRWVSHEGAHEAEYLCNEHSWLGYIADRDLSCHLQSPSHFPARQMGGPWRRVAFENEPGPIEDDIENPDLQDTSPDLPTPLLGNDDEDDMPDVPAEGE